MTLWNVSRNVAHLLEYNNEREILRTLIPYPLEQRRFIVAIKHQDSSLLFCAVKNQLSSVVIYFLEKCGADPNSFGFMYGNKLTCLAVATLTNSEILVRTLLYYRADTEIVFSSDEITVLFYACTMWRFEIVQLLIENGANPNSRNLMGKTCLMVSLRNLELFKFLVSAGADINLVDKFGMTCLVLALKNNISQLITFLLSLEETEVRLNIASGTDSLYPAVQFSPRHVIKQIIKKGSYTTEEIATVNELQSCQCQVTNSKEKARQLWLAALKLRKKPIGTPMFETPHQAGKLKEVIHLFNADNIPPLLFLDSMSGFSVYTAYIYTLATWNVKDCQTYISLCKFLFKEMNSMEDTNLFRILVHGFGLVGYFFMLENVQKSNALEIFDLLMNYIKEIHTRLDRMTPQERSIHGFKIDYLMLIIINCFHQIHWKFPEDISWLSNSITRLIKLDLRGPCQKSLLQKCAISYQPLVERFFLAHKADVNSSDRLGKTVLDDLVETVDVSPNLISLIIDYGFDFHEVKHTDYCLPCRLRRRGLLPTHVKHTSLQCLAVKAFCENKMKSFNEVPRHLMPIVKSHLYN